MDIYLDMDGVIANWTKAIALANGATYPQGRILRPYELDEQLKRPQIETAMATPQFWENLEIFPWAHELVNWVNDTCPTWRFLTKANVGADSYSGKAYWIDKHFPQHRERLVVCRGSKTFACKSRDILIDDHPSNINAWVEAGGQGFIWWELSDDCDYRKQLNNLRDFLFENYES